MCAAPVIVHRFGPRGQGLELLVAAAVPEAQVVPWPGPGEVLATLDSAWEGHAPDPLPERVRWVHVLGAGVGNFPLQALGDRVLSCSKGASSPAIAEFVLATMLAFEKRIPDVWIDRPPERWGLANLGGLAGRVVGLVGFGTIGQEVARRALSFDMTVLATRRTDRPAGMAGVGLVADLAELLARADHVVIAAPATAATRHLIGRAELAAVKPGAHLVNVARGSLLDHDALIEALDAGRIEMASLDVADPEPPPAGHPLYTHPRVRLSPHVSWSSPRTLTAMVDVFTDNLRRWQAGEPLRGVVDVDAGY